MAPHSSAPAEVIFGIDPMLFAGVLFALTYLLIMTERVNRAIDDGVTALLAMHASCASGVTVVGIDNGFGAACAIARMFTWPTR